MTNKTTGSRTPVWWLFLARLTAALLAFSCGETPDNKNLQPPQDVTRVSESDYTVPEPAETLQTEDSDSEYFYIVTADTHQNYFFLDRKMLEMAGRLNLPIDTMGRYYNPEKNKIILPETDEDDVWAGDYYPRRFPSDFLSLEHLSYYQLSANPKTIALIAGIFETEQRADSAVSFLKKQGESAFSFRAKLFTGCLH